MTNDKRGELRGRAEALQAEAERVFARLTDTRVKQRFQQTVFFHLDDIRVVVFGAIDGRDLDERDEHMWLTIGNTLAGLSEQSLDQWRSLVTQFGDRLKFVG